MNGELRRRGWTRVRELLGPFLGLALVVAFFAVQRPGFLHPDNLISLCVQNVYVILCALGMTFVIVSGGIDLSVGSVIALACVVTAWLLDHGQGAVVAAMGGVLTGGVCGLVNGLAIVGLRVVPFVATLGMMGIARGVAKWVADLQTINPGLDRPSVEALDALVRETVYSPAIWGTLAIGAAMAFVLNRTVFGTYAFAIGSNEATARLCGVPVERTKVWIYVLCGLSAGLGGVALFSRLGLGDPTGAVAAELDVIAAVVIGGASLAGGTGSMLGAMVGALLMGALDKGCTLMNWNVYVKEILTGLIIVAAVAIERLRHRSDGRC